MKRSTSRSPAFRQAFEPSTRFDREAIEVPLLVVVAAIAALTACSADVVSAEGEGEGEGEAAVTYYRDVQPLLERSCHACHVTGGIAPFAFTDAVDAQGMAPALVDAVGRGIMPPYFAKTGCRETTDDTRLTDAQKAILRAWNDAGAPLGDEADSVHAEPVSLPSMRADLAYDIGGAFDVASLRTDDNDLDVYRCFDIDLGLTEDTAVTAYEVQPDNRPLVHHGLAYTVTGDDVQVLRDLDAAEPGLGYACESGGVGVNGAIVNLAASWVPGATVSRMPEGTGIMLPAGAHLVFQVHYNVVAIGDDPFDQTRIVLEMASPADRGGLIPLRTVPMLNGRIDIAAGSANEVESFTAGNVISRLFAGAKVYAATGHMHQLGTNVRLDVIHADDSEGCVVDIGPWDFNWQRQYTFVEPLTINEGDTLRITCTYDNSAANQAVVGGVQQAPRDVGWGESSLDEMCMVYLAFTGGAEGRVDAP